MKTMGSGTFISKEGIVATEISNNESMDPEVLDALEHTDNYDELDDDFIYKANVSDEEEPNEIKFKKEEIKFKDEIEKIDKNEIDEDYEYYDDGDIDDIDGDINDIDGDINDIDKYDFDIDEDQYIPKHAESLDKTFLDQKFDIALENFDNDDDYDNEVDI